MFLLFIADGFRASTRVIARRLELKVESEMNLIEFFEGLVTASQDLGALRNEIKLLLERLDGIKDDLPTLEDLNRVSRDVLPYCFIGDVSQRAGQDVSQVQLDSAAAMWSETVDDGFESTHSES